jgi:hypothetical protein
MTISNQSAGKMLAGLLSAMLTFVLSLNVACAMDSKKTMSKSIPLTQAYVWYDGDREQQVWLNPQVIAEFNPGTEGESAVKNVYSGAKIMAVKQKQAVIRLWQLDNTAETAIRSLKASHPQGNYSAVLHDGPDNTSRMRALPGNVIVYLNPQWDRTAVNNWLSARKLEMVKKLEIGPNIYVIKTGPGMEALEIANALYRSGEVKAAFPDWWQEVVTR